MKAKPPIWHHHIAERPHVCAFCGWKPWKWGRFWMGFRLQAFRELRLMVASIVSSAAGLLPAFGAKNGQHTRQFGLSRPSKKPFFWLRRAIWGAQPCNVASSRLDSGWCQDLASVQGAWGHAGVRFSLVGAFLYIFLFLRFLCFLYFFFSFLCFLSILLFFPFLFFLSFYCLFLFFSFFFSFLFSFLVFSLSLLMLVVFLFLLLHVVAFLPRTVFLVVFPFWICCSCFCFPYSFSFCIWFLFSGSVCCFLSHLVWVYRYFHLSLFCFCLPLASCCPCPIPLKGSGWPGPLPKSHPGSLSLELLRWARGSKPPLGHHDPLRPALCGLVALSRAQGEWLLGRIRISWVLPHLGQEPQQPKVSIHGRFLNCSVSATSRKVKKKVITTEENTENLSAKGSPTSFKKRENTSLHRGPRWMPWMMCSHLLDISPWFFGPAVHLAGCCWKCCGWWWPSCRLGCWKRFRCLSLESVWDDSSTNVEHTEFTNHINDELWRSKIFMLNFQLEPWPRNDLVQSLIFFEHRHYAFGSFMIFVLIISFFGMSWHRRVFLNLDSAKFTYPCRVFLPIHQTNWEAPDCFQTNSARLSYTSGSLHLTKHIVHTFCSTWRPLGFSTTKAQPWAAGSATWAPQSCVGACGAGCPPTTGPRCISWSNGWRHRCKSSQHHMMNIDEPVGSKKS